MNTTSTVPARFIADITDGRTFDYIAASNRSADQLNYRHMVPAATYGVVVVTLGRAASMGDFFAEAVRPALVKISPYFNDWQIAEAIAEAFGDVVRHEWKDIRTATGPEPGIPSSTVHAVTFHQKVMLNLIWHEISYDLQLGSVPGPGWALKDTAIEAGITPEFLNAQHMPRVAAALA